MAANWAELDNPTRYGCIISSFAFALYGLFSARTATVVLDGLHGLLEWSRPTLFGRKTGSRPLHRIERVRIDTHYSDTQGSGGHRIVAELDGELVPFQSNFSRGPTKRYQETVDQIRDWLAKHA
jgi:hypothetical protein